MGLGEGPGDLVLVLWRLRDERIRREAVPKDPDALAILIRSLIENALDHGTGVVRLNLSRPARLTIENRTSEATFIYANFRSGARSRGMGLGLSIMATLCEAMGGRSSSRSLQAQHGW